MSGFTFERHSRYCTLKFTPELSDMAWEAVESATNRVIQLIDENNPHALLIDMSALEHMPTGMVASLVRIWKACGDSSDEFIVYAPSATVTSELEQSGLESLWTLTTDVETAYDTFGVTAPTDVEIDQIPVSKTAEASGESGEPFVFDEQRAYCSVHMNPVLMSLGWEDVERSTTDVIEKCRAAKNNCVLVDIGRMQIINSALVASLVRIWKSTQESNGQFSLVSPNEAVTGVLKSAGLWKLWSVVDDREEAAYDLGVSRGALVEKRERRLLVSVAVPCAVIALVAVVLMYLKRDDALGVNAQLTSLLLGAAAVATGSISVLKDTGLRRVLSILSVLVGLFVLSTLWIQGNPITFRQPIPDLRFGPGTEGSADDGHSEDPGDSDESQQQEPDETDEHAEAAKHDEANESPPAEDNTDESA